MLKTSVDEAFDKKLQKVMKRGEKSREKMNQGARRVKTLLQERRQEDENSISNHIVVGGFLLVLLATIILFSIAKSAGNPLQRCFAFAALSFTVGNIPFAIIWMIKHKSTIYMCFLFVATICSLCCSTCTGLWYCIFWCRIPLCIKRNCSCLAHDVEDGCISSERIGLKRKLDRIFCCVCQRGICMRFTPSCLLCTQCHTPCFAGEQSLRRQSSIAGKRRRVAVFQNDDGTVTVAEILPNGEERPVALSKAEIEHINKDFSQGSTTHQPRSLSLNERMYSLRGISSSDRRRSISSTETRKIAEKKMRNREAGGTTNRLKDLLLSRSSKKDKGKRLSDESYGIELQDMSTVRHTDDYLGESTTSKVTRKQAGNSCIIEVYDDEDD